MTVREKMVTFREKMHADLDTMASKCGTSRILLGMVENGEVTHPEIVKRIQKQYKLTDIEAEELLPINRRPHHPEYDPDRYVSDKDKEKRITIVSNKSKESEFLAYKNDMYGRKTKDI